MNSPENVVVSIACNCKGREKTANECFADSIELCLDKAIKCHALRGTHGGSLTLIQRPFLPDDALYEVSPFHTAKGTVLSGQNQTTVDSRA